MTIHAFLLAGLLATLVGCADDNAQIVCERLSACGCLTESVDACAGRIEDLDEDQLEVCGHCISTNDYMCHELTTVHGACRRCTDDFASPTKGRDLMETGKAMGLDVETSCIDVMPDDGSSDDAGTP